MVSTLKKDNESICLSGSKSCVTDSEHKPPQKLTVFFRESRSLTLYWFLAFFRILLTFIPQKGYIHPDEFFQTTEVVAGDILSIEAQIPWEFNSTFPVRNVVLPYLVVGTPIWFWQLFQNLDLIRPISTYTLLVLPRLVCCLISFINDYSLYRICLLEDEEYRTRLLAFASSYVIIIYATRTFTNAFELALVSLMLYVVSDCIICSNKVLKEQEEIDKQYSTAKDIRLRVELSRRRKRLPSHSLSHCFTIATITVIGVFNRPTFIGFAFPPIFFWLQRGLNSLGFSHFHLRLFLLVISSLPALLIFIFVDSIYYGTLNTLDFVKNGLMLRQFVVTPFNFILYNIDSSNLSNHGLHPRFTHLLVNVPLLYGILGATTLFSLLNIFKSILTRKWHHLPRTDNVYGLMLASILVPVGLLSIFPHQEPRFLLPVTVPIVFLYSFCIQERRNVYVSDGSGRLRRFKNIKEKKNIRQMFRASWFLFNACFILFYGFVHQGGIYPLLDHLSKEVKSKPRLTHIHLVTSHIYSLPVSFLQIESSKKIHQLENSKLRYVKTKDFHLYELGSIEKAEVPYVLESIIMKAESEKAKKHFKYKVYYSLPYSKLHELNTILHGHNLTFTIDFSSSFHISTEAMPQLKTNHKCLTFPKVQTWLHSFKHGVLNSSLSENVFSYFMDNVYECYSVIQDLNKQFGLVLIQVSKHLHA
nr:PREDICTED: GPI mannosyltransferase 4 [Bemisia tabaci]